MKKSLLISTLLYAAAMCIPAVAAESASGWESVKSDLRDAKSVIKDSEIEILTTSSCIIVNSPHKVHIKVFTILGRLVSEETLPPGVSRLNVGAHGVYIIKVGEITCKVAI